MAIATLDSAVFRQPISHQTCPSGHHDRHEKSRPHGRLFLAERKAEITASSLLPGQQPEQPERRRQQPGQPERPGQQRQRPGQPEPEQRPGQQLPEPEPEPEQLLLSCRKRTEQQPAGQRRGAIVSLSVPSNKSSVGQNMSGQKAQRMTTPTDCKIVARKKARKRCKPKKGGLYRACTSQAHTTMRCALPWFY